MRHTRISLLVRVCSWLLAFALPATAFARDSWTDPYPGVRHLHRRGDSMDLHLMVVDLSRPEVSLVTTRQEDRGLQTREFARQYGAQIAVNANYFDSSLRTCGMAASDGNIWSASYVEGCDMSLGFGDFNEAAAFESGAVLHGPFSESWMRGVVSGKPWLIRDGVIQGGWEHPRHIRVRHPRTALGISEDRNTLLVAVVDGRRSTARGMNGTELASLLAEFGAHNAFNLDGGGSTELFVAGEGGVQNRPSDAAARGVSNHFGIRIDTSARWHAAELENVEADASTVVGGKVRVRMTYRNAGRRPWTLDEEHGVSLGVASGRPSALWDPNGWISTTVASRALRVVAPGERYTFDFDVAAPAVPGEFATSFVPTLSSGEALSAPTEIRLAVTGDAGEEVPSDVGNVEVAFGSERRDAPIFQASVVGAESPRSSWWFALGFASIFGVGYKLVQRRRSKAPRNRRVLPAE